MMDAMQEENDEEDEMFANWLQAVNRTCGDMPAYMGPIAQPGQSGHDDTTDDTYDSDSDHMDHPSSSDEDDIPTLVNRIERLHRPKYRYEADSDVADDLDKDLPEWFEDQAFQYNGRVALVALPGLFLIMSLAGELLLTIVTIGGFIIHLLQSSGAKDKAFVAYMLTFIVSQMCVLYAAVPLLWKSVVNLVLVWAVNMFSAMTGVWLMLPFAVFRRKEPHLARGAEVMLFSLYPAISVVLLTWFLSSLTATVYAPYYLLLLGFVILQVFTQPSHSSFIKPCPSHPQQEQESGLLLEPTLAAVLALNYCVASPALFVVLTVFQSGPWGLFTANFVIEWMFLCSSSAVLSTFLGIRLFMEKSGIAHKHLSHVRWGAGLLCLCLVGVLLKLKGAASPLLPSLPVGVLLHVGFGYFMKKKQWKDMTFVFGAALMVYYVLIFLRFPWRINYLLLHGSVPVQYVFVLLFISAVLSLEVVYAAIYFPMEEFGAALVAQTIVVTLVEKVLWACELLPLLYMLLITSAIIYSVIRLYDSKKIAPRHASLVSGLHVTCLATSLLTPGRPLLPGLVLELSVLEYVTTAALSVVMAGLVLFEQRQKLSQKEFLQYMFGIAGTCVLTVPTFFHRALTAYVTSQPGLAEYSGAVLVVCACAAGKLTMCHTLENMEGGLRYTAPVLLGVAGTLVQLQPRIHLTLASLTDWSLVVSVGTLLLLPKLHGHLRSTRTLAVVSTAIGAPVGVLAWQGLYSDRGSMVGAVECIGLSTGCVGLALMVWTQHKEKAIFTLCLCLLSCVLKDVGFIAVQREIHTVVLVLGAATSLIVAGILKLNSKHNSALQLTVDGRLRFSRLPLVANIATIIAFVELCVLCPWQSAQCYWFIVSTCCLFLLQKDRHLLRNLSSRNHVIPTASASFSVLLFFAVFSSDFWLSPSAFTTFRAGLELGIVASTVPVWTIGGAWLWTNGERTVFNERLAVLFTPLSALLLVMSSSNPARLLGLGTVMLGVWLITYKLSLQRS